MNHNVVFLALALSAAVDCSTIKQITRKETAVPDSSAGLGVYHGSKTCIKDHPSLGALIVEDKYFCQVTIVSPSWVVTIVDCVQDYGPSDLSVVVGSEDGLTGEKFKVAQVVKHPKAGGEDFDYNYACVQIKGQFKWSDKVKAVDLPKKTAGRNTKMVVAGWGSSSSVNSDDSNNEFLQGQMTWLDKKKCQSVYKAFGITWTDRMACAYNKAKTTLCTGDWADAFINKNTFYGMFQAGPTSGWCTSEALPILLVDVATEAEWIKKTTGAKFVDE